MKRKGFSILFALVLVISLTMVATVPAWADATPDHYVNAGGSNTPPYDEWGKAAHKIQDAINAAGTGDTVHVAAGTYQENLASWKDMEITKSLTLIGAGSGVTVVELTEGKANGVEIRQTAYDAGNPLDVIIEGMTFTKASGSTNAANRGLKIGETQSAIDSLTLRDVEVSYAAVNNIEICGPSTIVVLTIENSNFHHAGSHGLMAPGDISSGTITNTHFDNNGRLDIWASGMHLFGYTSDLLVTGCSMSNNTDSGFNGRQLTNVTLKDIVASDNTHAAGGYGIAISEKASSSSDVTLENITAENNGRDGILIWTWYSYCSISDVIITGGLFTGNGWAGIRVTNWPASAPSGTISDVTITRAQIEDNPNTGVWFDLGYVNSDATGSQVIYNNIVGNDSWGVLNSGVGTLDATKNWWGHASGPSGPDGRLNKTGKEIGQGDAIYGPVDWDPWLPQPINHTKHDPVPPGLS